jgi:glycosyltransferase involved in cell wall biosynthesis
MDHRISTEINTNQELDTLLMKLIKILVIIPAYNERITIGKVITEVNKVAHENNLPIDVLVINDCSTDDTTEVVKRHKCVLLNLPVNLGIGGAVQTGFKYAFENNYDIVIQVDGDGQHPPTEIPKLINNLLNNNLDIVIGSRFIENTGYRSTFLRRLGITFFNKLIKLLCKITITDSTSGFRIINRKTLSIAFNRYPDEYPEPESIIIYSMNNLNIGEIPVIMCERQGGKSSIKSWNSIYYMMRVTIGMLLTYIKLKNNKQW